ncbi:hypothetical protein SAMN04487934_11024 [Eubacterium ruminantium]|nr:hypothetical protein SAMN04487934_11024 [Eubacterium ruminantium]
MKRVRIIRYIALALAIIATMVAVILYGDTNKYCMAIIFALAAVFHLIQFVLYLVEKNKNNN